MVDSNKRGLDYTYWGHDREVGEVVGLGSREEPDVVWVGDPGVVEDHSPTSVFTLRATRLIGMPKNFRGEGKKPEDQQTD